MKAIFTGMIAASLGVASISFAQGRLFQSGTPPNRARTLEHLGPNGLAKCRAFRRVRQQTAALQRAGGGSFSAQTRRRLEAELKAAKAMPPASTTPEVCGVPL